MKLQALEASHFAREEALSAEVTFMKAVTEKSDLRCFKKRVSLLFAVNNVLCVCLSLLNQLRH